MQASEPSPLAGDPGSRLRASLPSQNRVLGHPALLILKVRGLMVIFMVGWT